MIVTSSLSRGGATTDQFDAAALKIVRLGGFGYLFNSDFDPQPFQALHQPLPLALDLLSIHMVTAQVRIRHLATQQMIHNHEYGMSHCD